MAKKTDNKQQQQNQQQQVDFNQLSVEEQIEVLEKERVNAEQRAWYMKGRIDQLKQVQQEEKSE